MSAFPMMRFVCQKCGKVTFADRYTDCEFYFSQTGTGEMRSVVLCPEHRAEWVRWMSDFFEEIEERF